MGLDITFYHVNKKLSQKELIEVANTTGIGEGHQVEWFSGRSYAYILDSLRDDLKERYGQGCFDNYVRLERKDVGKLVLDNIHKAVNDEYRTYTSILALLINVLDQVDFDKETFFMCIDT